MRILRLRLRSLFQRRRLEAELAEELAGLPEAGSDAIREACREQRGLARIENFFWDLRRATRALARAPGFTLAAVALLALGIGAATAIFSLADAALLSPLPGVRSGAGLVHLERWEAGQLLGDMSYPDYLDYRRQTHVLTALAAMAGTSANLTGRGFADAATGEFVSGNFFAVLGVAAEHGRLLSAPDSAPGHDHVVVVSDAFWRSHLGANPEAIGSTINLNRSPFTIVGIASRGFAGASQQWTSDYWVPISTESLLEPMDVASVQCFVSRSCGWITAFGRLKPGATLAQAQVELTTISARVAAAHPEEASRRAAVVAGLGSWSDDRATHAQFLDLLLAGSLLLALMAAASTAGLFLARQCAAQRTIATQLALGAPRGRVLQRLLLEAGLVAAAGATLGLASAPALARALLPFAPTAPANLQIAFDGRLATFAILIAALATLVVATAPAWLAFRTTLSDRLRQASGASARHRAQRALLAAQVAIALLLLASASLAGRALQRATAGVVPAAAGRTLLARLDTSFQNLPPAQASILLNTVRSWVATEPGVTAVLGACIPPAPCNRGAVFVAGHAPPPGAHVSDFNYSLRPDINAVSPGFLRMFDIPLLAGRNFAPSDTLHSPRIAIINRRLARALWPAGPALGQRLAWPAFANGPDRGGSVFTVVGIVADRPTFALLTAPHPQLYIPEAQLPSTALWIAILGRVRTPAKGLLPLLQHTLTSLDPGLVPTHVRTLADQVRRSLWQPLAIATLAGAFGLAAAALAAAGMFAAVALAVAERRRELGIRLALGAAPAAPA
ncbi:MAG: ABC transporter permease, partial [Terriglobales bacterium]